MGDELADLLGSVKAPKPVEDWYRVLMVATGDDKPTKAKVNIYDAIGGWYFSARDFVTELDALANVDFTTREPKKEHRTLTILRIGTCGAVQADIPLGSPIFSHYSVGCDGLMNWYEGRDELSNLEMEKAFKEHTHWDKNLPSPYFVKASEKLIKKFEDCSVKGMTISASGFYGPQGRVVRQGLAMPDMLEDFESFRFGEYRITNFEMESSAVAGMAKRLGHEAGTICCAIANRYLKSSNPDYKPQVRALVELALNKLCE